MIQAKAAGPKKRRSWKVKRDDRSLLIRRKLEVILLRKPMSSYALIRLWRTYRGRRMRKKGLRRWQMLVRKALSSPGRKHLTARRLVLARLYMRDGQYALAVPLLRRAWRSSSRWRGVQQLLLRCHLKQRQLRPAARLFLPLWRKRTLRRGTLLFRMYALSLRKQNRQIIRQLDPLVVAHPWRAPMRAQLARLWLRDNQHHRGVAGLLRAAGQSRGDAGWRLRIEALRAMILFKRERDALATIATLRKRRQIPRWASDALWQAEIRIYRQNGRLYSFLLRLRRRWLGRKGLTVRARVAALIQLAGLFASIKAQEALVLYRKALVLKPDAKEPRLYLIQHFFRAKRLPEAHREMALLIQYNRAEPTHYLEWSRYVLRAELDRPRMPAWRRAWKQRKLCRRLKHKPAVMPQRPLRCLQRRRCRRWLQCHRKLWEPARRLSWQDWARRATATEKALFQKVQATLRSMLSRFPRRWNEVYVAHRLVRMLGMEKAERRAYRLLFRFIQPNPVQVSALLRMEHEKPKKRWLFRLLRRVLAMRPISPLHHLQIAENALTQITPLRRICGDVRRSIRKIVRSLPSSFPNEQFSQALRMSALRWRCRESGLGHWGKRLIKATKGRPKRLVALLGVLTQTRQANVLQKLLRIPRPAEESIALGLAWSRSWRLNKRESRWLRARTRAVFSHNRWPLYRWFQVYCSQAKTVRCAGGLRVARVLLSERRFRVLVRSEILLHAGRNGMSPRERMRWLRRLLKTKGFVPGAALLVRYGALFRGLTRGGVMHLRLMDKQFQRLTQPLPATRVAMWSKHLREHYRFSKLQRSVCKMSRRIFRSAIARWSPNWYAREARHVDALGRLFYRCSRANLTRVSFFRELRRFHKPARHHSIFQFLVAHRLSKAIQVMLSGGVSHQKALSKGAKPRQQSVIRLLRSLDAKHRQRFVGSTQLQCFDRVGRYPPHIPSLLASVCLADKGLCASLFRCFYALMHAKKMTHARLLSLLQHAQRQLADSPRYTAFLTRLIEYWKETLLSEGWFKERNFAALAALALRKELFQAQQTTVTANLASIHFRLLLYVLERRTTLPEGSALWLSLLRGYTEGQGGRTRRTLLQKSARRSVVVRALRFWLLPEGRAFVARLLRQRGEPSFTTPVPAGWQLWFFGPLYPKFRYPEVIEKLWDTWLQTHPKKSSLRAIARWNKRCCLDAVDRRMALRLMKWGIKTIGARKMRIEILRVQKKLTPKQRKELYRALGGYRTYFQQRMKLRR